MSSNPDRAVLEPKILFKTVVCESPPLQTLIDSWLLLLQTEQQNEVHMTIYILVINFSPTIPDAILLQAAFMNRYGM